MELAKAEIVAQDFIKSDSKEVDVRLIKTIPDKVLGSEDCPPEIVSEILKVSRFVNLISLVDVRRQNAPALLLQRNAINSSVISLQKANRVLMRKFQECAGGMVPIDRDVRSTETIAG